MWAPGTIEPAIVTARLRLEQVNIAAFENGLPRPTLPAKHLLMSPPWLADGEATNFVGSAECVELTDDGGLEVAEGGGLEVTEGVEVDSGEGTGANDITCSS